MTDGQCSDTNEVDEMMAKCISEIDNLGNKLDIFIVGAGSIGITDVQMVPVVVPVAATAAVNADAVANNAFEGMRINLPSTRLAPYLTRVSQFSHTIGSNSTFSGAECNRTYLMRLALLHSIPVDLAYAGAYRDYRILIEQFMSFICGDLDNTKFVYVSDNKGGWWPAKEHQYKIASVAFANPAMTEYDRDGFKVTIGKRTEDTLEVTDEFGTMRVYKITNGRMK